MKEISIIIVNYNTSELVINCIKSIKKNTLINSYEILIIDNSCNENEYQKLISFYEKSDNIIIIKSRENIGFGRANNLGANYSRGKYLLFLNSDTLLVNNAIDKMYELINKNNKIGIICPNLYDINMNPNKTFENNSTIIKIPFYELNPLYQFKKILYGNFDFNSTNKIMSIEGYISGACMMIKKELFYSVKGFDNEIFMYGEDVLLSQLVKKKGYLLVSLPNAKVIHLEGKSDKKSFSDFKIKNYVNGTYTCRLRLFGEERACIFLKQQYYMFLIKSIICYIKGDKIKATNKKKLKRGFKEKYNQICEKKG